MEVYDFEVVSILTELENETFFSEALLFPELCRYGDTADSAHSALRNSIPDFLDSLHVVDLHGRRAPTEYEIRTVNLALSPPSRNKYWQEPLPLEFQAVYWQQPGTHHVYLPALSIETVSDTEESVFELLPRNIVNELQRRGASSSLGSMMWLQRGLKMSLKLGYVDLVTHSPKKRLEALTEESKVTTILPDVATHLNVLGLPRAFEVDEEVKMLADLLVGRGGRSVLLVGESGVGKTAVIYELVSQRRRHHLGSTSFWETTGARLMVGADSFGDWQERCRKVVAEASSSRAVMLLGNLFELAEVARHSTTPEGMAGFFRPYLDRGDLLAVVECTPKQREILERDHPHLLQSFAVLELKKPSQEKVVSILSAVTRGKISEDALRTTERLHRRYAAYSAYPGRPLRFLRELQEEAGNNITPSTVAQAFAEETGMPVFIIDDSVPLELEETEEHFRSRIMGQGEAVSLVVDLLASVKAALSPPGKPIASLLFIGPTGVGKTEMARTLCGFLFRDRQRMVRFDMSEFSDPVSVERLVGGQEGGQGLLTSKVREQPFGLVLFDELEKADPAFFDLLLQILGEGRLTDEGGRVADFTNSVVVMTSNLGAASFSKGPLGFRSKEDNDHARQTFTSAVKAAFRPELFNRIDRLIPFAPLDLEIAKKVTEREIERMKLRDGLSCDWLDFEIGPNVASHLAQSGYDRRYGARPLKRALEKQLLEPLAPILSVAGDSDLKVKVELQDGKLVWSQERSQDKRANRTTVHLARQAMKARRDAQKIDASRLAHELRNRLHRLTRLEHRKARTGHLPEDLEAQLATLEVRRALAQLLKDTTERGLALETEAVLALQGFRPPDSALASKLQEQAAALDDLVRSLYASRFDLPDQATVIIYAEKSADLRPLAQAYAAFWKDINFKYSSYSLKPGARETEENKDDDILRVPFGEEAEDRALWCHPVGSVDSFGKHEFGAAFELKGKNCLPLMLGEAGLHLFGEATPQKLEVVVISLPLEKYTPPLDLHTRKTPVGQKRRVYSQNRGVVEDPHLELYKSWSTKGLAPIIKLMIEGELLRLAREGCS